jgi:hypothetical protein
MKTLGLNPKDLDLWDPEQAALATTALILSRKGDIEGVDKWYLRAQQHNTPGVGPKNEQRLKEADKDYANNVIRNASRIYSSKTGYGLPETEKWMNTKKAEKAKQEGEKVWSERFRPNIMRTESTGYIPNIPSMAQRAYGGLHKAQNGRIQAATTYASGKEQNYMSPERRAYEQSLANQLAERELRNTKGIADMAGLVFYPAALANATYDASQGNYGQAALSAFPWFKMAKGATKGGLKIAFGNTGAVSAAKDASEIYNTNPYGLIHKAYGGDLPKAQMYNSQVNRPTAESTFVQKPQVKVSLDFNKLYRDDLSSKFDYGYVKDLLKKYNVSVDSTGNVLDDLGLPSAAYYNPLTRTIHYKHDPELSSRYEYTRNVMRELPHAIQADSLGELPFLKNVFVEGVADLFNDNSDSRYDDVSKIEGHAHNTLEDKLYKEMNAKRVDYAIKKYKRLLDKTDNAEEYRRGGALPNRRETNKNIKSSINNLMRRNETLFGPAGRNFYNPNPMSKYYKGGIAFPQAPTAGSTPGQQETEFYAPNWIPRGPVGFYEHGGIAYPQQPTSDYFFSGSPWMAHYDMGGGLPGGANNMYMPCMNCGGYMEDGGLLQANFGAITPQQYKQAQTDSMTLYKAGLASKNTPSWQYPGATEAAGRLTALNKNSPTTTKGEFYTNQPGYTGGYGVGFQKPSMVPFNSTVPTPLIQSNTQPSGSAVKASGPSSDRQAVDFNANWTTYKGKDNKLSYFDRQTGQQIDPTKSTQSGKYIPTGQEGGYLSQDNMMDYPIFSQGGDPYSYADGGNVADYDQEQYVRTLGNSFLNGVQSNMQNDMLPQAGVGYNMNSFNAPNMMNAGNMFDMQDQYDQLKNKNKGIGANMYNAGMFAFGTANPHTKYKARKKGSGTLPGTPDMTGNQGVQNTINQSADSAMARYGAAYIPKADVGFNMRQQKAAGFPQLSFPSSTAQAPASSDSWMSPEAQAKKQAFRDQAAAYDKKYAAMDQAQQAALMQQMQQMQQMQRGQFAPNNQGMYDMFGNDDYNVGRMSRGMQNMLPYLMFNPQNTYLKDLDAKKALFGPGARRVKMSFRTVFDPRTGQQVQVPTEEGANTKGKTSTTNKEVSPQKEWENMNMFERMKSNRELKRMMKEDERRAKASGAPTSGSGSSSATTGSFSGGIPARPYGPDDFNNPAPEGTITGSESSFAPSQAAPQSGYPMTGGYNFNAQLEGDNSRFNFMPQRGMSLPGSPSPDLRGNPAMAQMPGMQQTSLFTPNSQFAPNALKLPPQSTPASRVLFSSDEQGNRVPNTFQSYMQNQLQGREYGGMYKEGGIHELTEDEIQQILAAGGSITYID